MVYKTLTWEESRWWVHGISLNDLRNFSVSIKLFQNKVDFILKRHIDQLQYMNHVLILIQTTQLLKVLFFFKFPWTFIKNVIDEMTIVKLYID